jgi:hypothetical protein
MGPPGVLLIQDGAVVGGFAAEGWVVGLAKLNAASPATDANNATAVHLLILNSLA